VLGWVTILFADEYIIPCLIALRTPCHGIIVAVAVAVAVALAVVMVMVCGLGGWGVCCVLPTA